MSEQKYKIKKHQKLAGSIVEVELELPEENLLKHWSQALKHIGEHAELDGFRKGHIPEKVLVGKVGEMAVLEDCAENALENVYPAVVDELKIHPIGSPKVVITKIGKGSPLLATLHIYVIPEVTLPDYKSIVKKINAKKDTISVDEKEVESVVEEIKKHRATTEKAEVTELTDDFVKTLGAFKDVTDFRDKIKENIQREKEYKAKEKKRIEMIEGIRKESKVDMPEILVENELDRMVHEFSGQLSQTGHTFEKYLTEIKKTEADLRSEWKDKARERAENELMIFEIAKHEKIEPKKEDVEKEVATLSEHYKDTPRERLVAFIEDVLVKEEVFKFLEAQK